MAKYDVTVRYPVKGYEIFELEVEASSEEEAEQKSIDFVQMGECVGVTELRECYHDDMQAYCEGFRPCEYDVEVYKIEVERI